MITWSAIPSRSAGPETAGPSRRSTIGTTPDASDIALATRPHAWSAATPSFDVGARAGHPADDGNPEVGREPHRPLDGLAFRRADRAAVLPAVEVEPAHLPTVEIPEGRLDRFAPAPVDGRRRIDLRHSAGG